jgi:DNA-binding NtrC family response regulator
MIHDWPGNVRELENTIECALALSSDRILTIDALVSLPHGGPAQVPDTNKLVPLAEIERRAVLHALRETAGDKPAAARLLGIGKTTLYRKLKEYGGTSKRPDRDEER